METSTPLSRRIDPARRLLTPPGHRLPLVAAGAVPWAVGFALLDLRMTGAWPTGVLAAMVALAAALPLAIGLLATAPVAGERPGAPVAVLLLAGLALALIALGRLTDALGADGAFGTRTSAFVGASVYAAAVYAVYRVRRVPVLVLVTAVAVGAATLAFVDLVFDPGGTETFRWVLLALMLGFLGAHAQVRERTPREGVLLLDAAGLAALALGLLVLGGTLGPAVLTGGARGAGSPAGWEFVLLAAGFGLAAFAAVEREPGPGFLGVAVLAEFVVAAGERGEPGGSLLWWPLLLLVAGGVAIGAGLRPARPLPPEPTPPGGPGETVPMPPRPAPGPGSEEAPTQEHRPGPAT